MATKSVQINDAAYTQLDTGVDTTIDCQNISSGRIKIILAASLPAPEAQNYYIVPGGAGVSRDGKTGIFYAISLDDPIAFVTVGE